jgi:hypothetical protein
MTCRAYFIPVPLMGLTLRGFTLPAGAVCSLKHRCPHEVSHCRNNDPFFRAFPPEESRPSIRGLAEYPAAASLGLAPSRVCDRSWRVGSFRNSPIPSHALEAAVTNHGNFRRPRVFPHERRCRSPKRSANPPGVDHLVVDSNLQPPPWSWVTPLETICVTTNRSSFYTPR